MWRRIIWAFSWLIYRLFINIFFKFEIRGRENYKNLKKPFIIASNHASYLDGEIISIAFHWNSRFFPIRFMAAEYYYNQLILGSILWFLGSFPVKQGIGIDKALELAVKLIRNDEVVGIFPEGKKTRDGNLGEGKPGISYLALKTGAMILPIGLSGTFGLSPANILLGIFKRRKIIISFGKPFYLKDYVGKHNPDPEKDREILLKGAEIVMKKIKKLI